MVSAFKRPGNLIDGMADPNHLPFSQRLAAELKKAKCIEPGRTGLFGRLADSW
jgi:hypothetical protein